MPLRPSHAALAATLLAWLAASALCQTKSTGAAKTPASLAGVVTVDGRPAAGIPVWVSADAELDGVKRSTETDSDGHYVLAALPPGRYVVSAFKSGYYVASERLSSLQPAGRSVTLDEGATVEGFDLDLTRGGVITGRVTDLAGRPLAEVLVEVETRDASGRLSAATLFLPSYLRTDDRGVYRAYGLPPGRYYVAATEVGRDAELVPKTYFPASVDPTEAKIVEILGAEETSEIDIAVATRGPRERFVVTGRVVDAETGSPLAGAKVGLHATKLSPSYDDNSFEASSATNAEGEFRVAGVLKGSYEAEARRPCDGDDCWYPAGEASVEVNADTSGVVVRSPRGLTLDGRIVVDGAAGSASASGLKELKVKLTNFADYDSPRATTGLDAVSVGPDGSFSVFGLRPGMHHVFIFQTGDDAYHLLRVEGVPSPDTETIDVEGDRDLSDVRFVVAYGTGVVRGRVAAATGGALPAGTEIIVEVENDETDHSEFPDVDERGQFVLTGLLPGRYTVTARTDRAHGVRAKSTATISEARPSADVSLTIDVSASGSEPEDDEDERR